VLGAEEGPDVEAHGGTSIGVPAEEVFDYVADARNEPKWLPGATDVRLSSPEPIGLGSRFTGTYARAGTVELEITDFQRPFRLTIHGDAKGMTFEDEIRVESIGDGAHLSAVMRTQPKGVFKLIAPMMGRVISKQFHTNWENFPTALERNGSAPSP
jgi:carbon monoxide dehydrogenase subunit G